MYLMHFTDDALADISAMDRGHRNALKKELKEKVRVDPAGWGEELGEPLEVFRSFHFLKYRVIYRVFPDLLAIAVVGVGVHDNDATQDIYKRLEALAKSGKLAERVLNVVRNLHS